MDNLETNADPQEAADVTAASGQSVEETQETTEVETPTTLDGGEEVSTEEKASFPWESDNRFKGKSPDDMYKIVAEADKYKGQLSQKAKLADMLSEKYGLTPERMEQIAMQQEEVARQQRYANDPTAPLYDEVASLKQQLLEQQQQSLIQTEDTKLDKFIQENPDFSDFREEIRKLGYTVERGKDWDKIANHYFGRAITKGQEAAYKKMGVKQQTQATSVSRGAPKTGLTNEDLKSMSLADLEAMLPHADTSHRL